jgi:hypothetical protein
MRIAVENPIIKNGRFGNPINWFNSATVVCLSQAST